MSHIVTTKLGRFRRVNTGDPKHPDAWLFECPGCGQWAYLDEGQWRGKVSVDHASDGCSGRYHETHNFAVELLASIQAAILTGTKPYSEDSEGPGEGPRQ